MIYHPLPEGCGHPYVVSHKFKGLRIDTWFTDRIPLPRAADIFDSDTGEDCESENYVPF